MEKIICRYDKEAEVILDENTVRCCNLIPNSGLRRSCWLCKITKKACGYAVRRTSEVSYREGFSFFVD